MARRSTPERINAAHREGVRQRLISTRMSAEKADALLAEWEALANRDGLAQGSDYWTAAWEWFEAKKPRLPR